MIEQPKCCGTCRNLQREVKYCHKKKQTRFNILAVVNCDSWNRGWRQGWKTDMGPAIIKPAPIKIGFLDAIEMGR